MSSQASPASATSRSPNESPRSNRSRSLSGNSRQNSRSRSRSATPDNSGRSRSGSPRSQGSRTPSSHSETGIEPVQERKESIEKDAGANGNDTAEDAVGAEDIFGDDLSISSEDEDDKPAKKAVIEDDDSNEGRERSRSRSRSRSGSPARYDDDRRDDDEDMEKEPEKPPETVSIHVEVPKITTNLGKELYFVKLPNFLSVDCKPFDPETYEDEIEDEENPDEEGRERLKLKVENTIRWRQSFDSEGKAFKESNARVVRWSDGTTSLHLGSEIFDVQKLPLAGDFNHLFIRQGTGLQGQAIFRNKLSFRPHSTESFTHQKMTRQMADRTNRGQGIKVISQVGNDPEMGRYKRVKEEEERLRADLRRDSMVNRKKERATGRNLSKGYLEGGDSDEDGVSLAQIKNKYKKGSGSKSSGSRRSSISSSKPRGFLNIRFKGEDYVKPGYSSDEEDSDVETKKARRLEKAKVAIRDSEESEHSDGASVSSRKSRSRSQSPKSNDSQTSRRHSRSPAESGKSRSPRSISRSKSRSRSKSGSRSRSGSPVARSRSGSPNSGSISPSKSDSD